MKESNKYNINIFEDNDNESDEEDKILDERTKLSLQGTRG